MATTAMLLIALAGAAVAAYSAYAAAEQQKKTMETNARIREDDARQTRLAGEAAAERQRKKDEARMNSFRSRAGAAGVVAGEGSSLLAELDFATDAEMEAQHTKYGYTLNARSKDIQAGFMRSQAADIHPEMEAGISLLSSAGSIATSYYSGSQPTGGGTKSQTGGGLTTTRGTSPSPTVPDNSRYGSA